MFNKGDLDPMTDEISTQKGELTRRNKIRKHMITTLKEMFNGLRHPEFKFAPSGIIISVVLSIISLFFFLGPYLFTTGTNRGIELFSFTIYPNVIGILISFGIAFLEIYLWFLVGIEVTPKAAHYLVDNKILKLLFTKGHVHYLEYVPVEKRKIAMPHILNKYIALIIAWVSLSAFLLQLIAGIFLGGNPSSIINPGSKWLLFLIRTLVIFLLVPLVFTLVYPVGWMLVDAKLKAYNSFTRLNWLVGKKVVNLTAGIITVGAIIGLGATALDEFLPKMQLIFDLVIFCVVNVSLIVTIIAIFYNIFFQGTFYRRIIDSIDVGFGVTSVTLVTASGDPIPKEIQDEDLKSDTKSEMREFTPLSETSEEGESELLENKLEFEESETEEDKETEGYNENNTNDFEED
ncbi:hypothetical protein CEE45_08750 [Candidatus Heimdallarchaeota archaeon B3_Heim]|nr:MAG: hypothetical protein CEE45_08750 [Candidatus Heimdallarchaeota archaeon B3_Heim]